MGPLPARGRRRGGHLDIADAIGLLEVLFGGRESDCPRAIDANHDEFLDIADPIALFATLFQGEDPPPPPAHCSLDPTPGALCCDGEACP